MNIIENDDTSDEKSWEFESAPEKEGVRIRLCPASHLFMQELNSDTNTIIRSSSY